MKSKRGISVALKSMKEFERMYYPNNLAHKEQMLVTDDQELGKKFADMTFAQIKKKYSII